MKFRGDLRELIRESDLQYLSLLQRRGIIEQNPEFKNGNINQRVAEIFDGTDLRQDEYNTLVENYSNILLISRLCSNYNELCGLVLNNRTDIFFDYNSDVFFQLVRLSDTIQDFIDICSHDTILKTIDAGSVGNIAYIFGLFSNREELFELLENSDFIYLITKSKGNNINFILEHLDINSSKGLIALFENGKWEHIKKLLKNGNTEDIKKVLEVERKECLSIGRGYIEFNKVWIVGTCDESEEFNRRLLEEANFGDKSFIPIFWKDHLVAYLKMKEYGEESITGLRDMFDEDGILILKKGMIYAPEFEQVHEKSYNNGNKTWVSLNNLNTPLSINPIRMIDLDYLDYLIKCFKQRNSFK